MTPALDLSDKKLDLDSTAQRAARDPSLLTDLIACIAPENHNSTLRYTCFRVLMRLAASHPPRWSCRFGTSLWLSSMIPVPISSTSAFVFSLN